VHTHPIVELLRVAVLPFTVHGSGDLAYLGDGMVNLLGTSLDGAGDLHTVDRHFDTNPTRIEAAFRNCHGEAAVRTVVR